MLKCRFYGKLDQNSSKPEKSNKLDLRRNSYCCCVIVALFQKQIKLSLLELLSLRRWMSRISKNEGIFKEVLCFMEVAGHSWSPMAKLCVLAFAESKVL